jgi:hypothetical protein
MLEIFAIVWLSNKNKANALARGRKPGGFTGLTIALWFGLELIGFLIGIAAKLGWGAYVLGLVFAVIGGLISYLIAKNCKPGDYVPPSAVMADAAARSAQPLAALSRIDIVRESSMVGAVVGWSFELNGQYIGSLSNGKAMTVYTDRSQNVLVAKDAYGTEIAPFVFGAQSGGFTEIHFKANRFIPENSRGLLAPVAPQPAPAAPQFAPPAAEEAFCTSCGSPLPEGMQFCMQCGAPLQNSAVPDGAPQYGAPAPAAAEPPANRPMRAAWAALMVFGAWLLMMLLQAAMGQGTIYNSSAMYVMTGMLLGAGTYLMMQSGIKYKLIAAGFLLAEAVMVAFNQAAIVTTSRFMGGMRGLFQALMLWPVAGYALVTGAIAAGLALLFSYIYRNAPDKKRVYATGWIAAGGIALYGIIRTLAVFLPLVSYGAMNPANFATILIGWFADAAALGLSVMVLAGISLQKKTRLRLPAWAIVWCSLSSLGMLSSFIISILQRYPTPVVLILLLAALTGYILLLCGKRAGLFILLIGISAYLLGAFQTALQRVLYGSTDDIVTMLSAVAGAANPVITWFSIRRAWMEMRIPEPGYAPAMPAPQKHVKKFSRAAALVVLIVGAFCFVAPILAAVKEGRLYGITPYMILIGVVITALSISATVSLFGRRSKYRKWLDVLMQVLFWIICAVVAGTLIVGIISALW